MSFSAVTTLKFLLVADDKISKAMQGAGKETEQTGQKMKGFSTGAKVAMVAAGAAVVGFAKASVDKFEQVTVESRQVQRALGGTLEQASRWREAAILSGVDATTFTKSAQKLDKTLVGAAQSTTLSAKMVKTLGFSFQDANGKVKPMGQLLPQIADKFAAMPDGADKTALAMTLFGKAGNSMLPMLSRGSAGIKDLMAQSDKFGTTLNGGAIDALSKSREDSRAFTAALDGLKVQIGAQLLPILNTLIGFILHYVLPVFQAITGFIKSHSQLFTVLGIVIGTLVAAWKLWTVALAVWNAVLAVNPIALVVIALVALGAGLVYAYKHSETFRAIVQGVFSAVSTAAKFMWDNFLKPIFISWKIQFNILKAVVMAVWNDGLHPVFIAIGAVFKVLWTVWLKPNIEAIKLAWKVMTTVISAAWNGVIKPLIGAFGTLFRTLWNVWLKPNIDFIKAGWHLIASALQTAWGIIKSVFNFIKSGISGLKTFVGNIVSGISNLWKGIGDGLQWVWDHTIGPIINMMRSGIQDVIDLKNTLSGNPNGITSRGGTLGGGVVGAPKHAFGGPVLAGHAYTVGERRTEVFIPNTSGRIMPDYVHHDNATPAAKFDTAAMERALDAILRELRKDRAVELDGYRVGQVMARQADRYSRGG